MSAIFFKLLSCVIYKEFKSTFFRTKCRNLRRKKNIVFCESEIKRQITTKRYASFYQALLQSKIKKMLIDFFDFFIFTAKYGEKKKENSFLISNQRNYRHWIIKANTYSKTYLIHRVIIRRKEKEKNIYVGW